MATPTPLILSTPLSSRLGKPVWLKMDALRPSGSFKDRGIQNLMLDMCSRGIKAVVSSSGGNAGLATAVCGRKLGIQVTVVVPETTKALMLDKLRAEGAEVIVHGADWNAANELAQELVQKEGRGFVHPFEGPLMWTGHASLVEEIKQQWAEAQPGGQPPGCVVLSVGGGGLLCGVLEGLEKVGWGNIPVITTETHGAASFAAAHKEGSLVTLPAITTIATSLGARCVSQTALDRAKAHPGTVHTYTTTDQICCKALVQFLNDHRILVEPACAVALSTVYERAPQLESYDSVCVIVCGGSAVNLDLVNEWSLIANPPEK